MSPDPLDIAEFVRHRFSWLPYDFESNPGHVGVLVVICDCGWSDLTNSGAGTGIEAAHLYADHLKAERTDGD